MKSKNLKSAIWLTLSVSAVAFAAVGPAYGKGRPGGDETATNSLSVPAVLVGGSLTAAAGCGADGTFAGLLAPSGMPLTFFPIDPSAYYYVQGVHKWQAQCTTAPTGSFSVEGAWGDNLAGDAKLKVGSPIRVELLLLSNGANAQGYEVVKLDPSALDRESSYGTLATVVEGGGYSATAMDLRPVVYDAGAKLKIVNVDTGVDEVPEAAISPEINATGKVIYGYNLRVSAAGKYLITFTMPNVTFTGCDAGVCENQTAELPITVGGGGGGGGKKGPRE